MSGDKIRDDKPIVLDDLDAELSISKSVEKNQGSIIGKITAVFALLMSLFHLFTSFFGLLTPILQRGIHLCFAVTILMLSKPMSGSLFGGRYKDRKLIRIILAGLDMLMIAGIWIAIIISNNEYMMRGERAGAVTINAAIAGAILLIVILECSRRCLGSVLPVLALVFIAYALFGSYLPTSLAHRGYSFRRIFEFLSTNSEGIFGTCLSVSATVIFMFILLGSFLEVSGGTDFFNNIAIAITGKRKSGPAVAAIIAAALMGTINGSAVANVVGTGTFTIPLMKKRGYSSAFSAAIAAVASTGGQILPPVMGSGAFLMVAFTDVPYRKIAASAVIPAILYFTGCVLAVIAQSELSGVIVSESEIPKTREVLKDGVIFLAVIAVLVYSLLFCGFSPMRSALNAIIAVPVFCLFNKEKRYNLKKFYDALVKAATGSIAVVLGCACAGIVVSMVAMTGVGVVFGNLMISASGGSLFLALCFSALACIILGMGLPTTASYVIAATVMGSALVSLGLSPITAHLFIFYYACLSSITPPVALAAYAGAGIANCNPMKTGIEACKISFAGFIVPFIFVYSPALILSGPVATTIMNALTAVIGTSVIAMASQNWLLVKLDAVRRILLIVGGICVMMPDAYTDILGLILLTSILYSLQVTRKKSNLHN